MDIRENYEFIYPIFKLKTSSRFDKAILLLHGLNERSWEKYITWSEYLCIHTGMPVIMFPIAFHINRSEAGWLNINNLISRLNRLRKLRKTTDNTTSLANVTLSERLIENPLRFFMSGMQSLNDIDILLCDVRSGDHPVFNADCRINIFAYSIGAFLADICMMVNPNDLFATTKAVFFCGGATFESMNGISRSIMDKECFDTLKDFYTGTSWMEKIDKENDKIVAAFHSMVLKDNDKINRYKFFSSLTNSLKIMLLRKDKVITEKGVLDAVGPDFFCDNVILADFDYVYSHEQPFPVRQIKNKEIINRAFNIIFEQIVNFYN